MKKSVLLTVLALLIAAFLADALLGGNAHEGRTDFDDFDDFFSGFHALSTMGDIKQSLAAFTIAQEEANVVTYEGVPVGGALWEVTASFSGLSLRFTLSRALEPGEDGQAALKAISAELEGYTGFNGAALEGGRLVLSVNK